MDSMIHPGGERKTLLPPPPTFESGLWQGRLAKVVFTLLILLAGGGGCLINGAGIDLLMEAFNVLFYKGLLGFLLTPIFFWLAFRNLRFKRWADNTPRSKVRSAAMGMVELEGTCERAYDLIAPASRFPCVYYKLDVYRQRTDRHGRTAWLLEKTKGSGPVPFYLCDESGRVRVDPQGATVVPTVTNTIFRTDALLGPITMEQVTSPRKFVEESIPETARVFVLGQATPSKTVGPRPLTRRIAEKLRILKSDRNALMKRYDSDRNGRLDENEWSQAVGDAEKAALEEQLRQSASGNKEEPYFIGKPQARGLPFIVAGERERSASLRFGILAVAFFLLAMLSLSAGIVFLIGIPPE